MPAMTSPELNEAALLAELNSLEPSGKVGQVCNAADQIGQLSPQLAGVVNAILWNRPDVSTSALIDKLAKHGIVVRDGNMRRHRRIGPNGCKCPGKPSLAAAE